MFSLSLPLHLSVTLLSLHLQVFLSGKQKPAAAIATESKGRPGPGLSPLKRPDWSRPAVWALLPCGRRGRQFSERCRGRRAISAVLSGQIYTAGSELIISLLWHILWLDEKEAQYDSSCYLQWLKENICWLIDCLLTLEMWGKKSDLLLWHKQNSVVLILHCKKTKRPGNTLHTR